MLRKLGLRLTAIMVIISMMLLSGCSFLDNIQKQIDPNSNKIAAPELIRLLVTAIDDPALVSESFESIPESQREELSYSYYAEYINIIREMSNVNGKVKSFVFLNDEDNEEHLSKMCGKLSQKVLKTTNEENLNELYAQYGDIRTAVFEYGVEPDHPVYTYIVMNDEGYASLSAAWITDVVDVYKYMQHYFGMIEKQNVDGIALLIRTASAVGGNTDLPEAYYMAKAESISEFYRLRVRNNTNEFKLNTANAFYTEYQIPEVLSADGNSIYSRTVSSYGTHNGNDGILIYDEIPQETDRTIRTVDISKGQYIRCGLDYDYSSITRILGKPSWTYIPKENISETVDSDGNEILKKRIVLEYNGLSLVFNAVYSGEPGWMTSTIKMRPGNSYDVLTKGETEWTGELVSIRICENSKHKYKVCDIGLGSTELDLITRFPMLEYGKYHLSYTEHTQTFDLDYTVEDGVVDSILITRR